MMRSCGRLANLLYLLNDDHDIRARLPRLIKAFEKYRQEDNRGTRTANLLDPNNNGAIGEAQDHDIEVTLGTALGELLNAQYKTQIFTQPQFMPRTVKKMNKASLRGVRYSQKQTLPRDSRVMFKINAYGDTRIHAGEVQGIFSYPCTRSDGEVDSRLYFIVERHTLLLEVAELANPVYQKCYALDAAYRRYGPAGGFLCSSSSSGGEYLVEQSQILSHFAKTPITIEGADLFHVLPLDQVSFWI